MTARSIADLDAGTILATVDIMASPERVYRALTSDDITRWWGSPEMYQTTGYTADLRVGGRWRAEGKGADGSTFHVDGEFLELDPPRKIVQTWNPVWDPTAHGTRVTYKLEPIDGGTRVTVRHEGFAQVARQSCADHANGWIRVLGWLDRFAAPAPEARFFFARLIPPRPSFAYDLTDAERAVMGRHAMYWKEHLARGTAIVAGPVADPAGPWGLGVLRVADEAAVRAFEAADPAVTELGMRYEVTPMLNALIRDA